MKGQLSKESVVSSEDMKQENLVSIELTKAKLPP